MDLLDEDNSLLIVIDVQEKLVSAVNGNSVADKTAKLVNAAHILNIPIIVSKQYPKGLGNTVEKVKEVMPETAHVLEKTSFSLLKESGFLEKLKEYNKKQIVLCGIETHICVYQTAIELVNAGFEVVVVKDACASRNNYEFNLGIDSMQSGGARISCLEIVLFEWLKSAHHPKFKEVQALIK